MVCVFGVCVFVLVTLLQYSILLVGKKTIAQRGEMTVDTVQHTAANSIICALPLLPPIMGRGSQT